MKSRKLALSVLTVPLTALLLAGCSQSTAQETEAQQTQPAAGLTVVATTNVYRDIAQNIGGEHIEATEIISSPAQDPHSYEPSARDKLTVSKADVVLANGGGYDDFMTQLVSSLSTDAAVQTVYAVDSSPVPAETAEHDTGEGHEHDHDHDHDHEHAGPDHEGHHHAGYNEHIWFDLESMSALAGTLAQEFSELVPEHAAEFEANAQNFEVQIQQLSEQLDAAGLQGQSFAMTEPVPYHLLVDAGMVDATPAGLSAAVEAGAEIPPQDLKALNDALQAGSIDLLAYNMQTEGSESVSIRSTAEANSVPVVEFAETMGAEQQYLQWIGEQISALSSALGE